MNNRSVAQISKCEANNDSDAVASKQNQVKVHGIPRRIWHAAIVLYTGIMSLLPNTPSIHFPNPISAIKPNHKS